MLRYIVQKDSISLFIKHDNFIIRPWDNLKTRVFEEFKVLISVKPEMDPFIFIHKPKGNINEWWIACSSNTIDSYSYAKTMNETKYLQLTR